MSSGDPLERTFAPSVGLHLLPDSATISSAGRLSIGGVDIADIVREVGSPIFVYDEDHIRTRIREAKENFDGEVVYASKAFLCKAMAALVAQEGAMLDVASLGEVYVALAGGFDPRRMILHGNNKSEEELAFATSVGVGRIVIDSFEEIQRLDSLASTESKVWIRANPGVEAHTHEFIRTGQTDSKFGFSIQSGDAALAIEAIAKSSNLTLVGVHAHIGSQIFRLASFEEEIQVLATFFNGLGIEELNVGGGLGVAYLNEEDSPRIGDWVAAISEGARHSGIAPGTRLFVEPGRAIVASAALTVYRVGVIKTIPDVRTYVAVDGGMSDNPRPVLYGSGYEAFLPERMYDACDKRYTVVGKHCESGDVLVRDAVLPTNLEVGELLATPVTGAYGHSMASNYNKVTRPGVVFVRDGVSRVVVRRETLDDLLRSDV